MPRIPLHVDGTPAISKELYKLIVDLNNDELLVETPPGSGLYIIDDGED